MQLDRHNDRRRIRKELGLEGSSPTKAPAKAAPKAVGRSVGAKASRAMAATDTSPGNTSSCAKLAATTSESTAAKADAVAVPPASKAARLGSSGSSLDNLLGPARGAWCTAGQDSAAAGLKGKSCAAAALLPTRRWRCLWRRLPRPGYRLRLSGALAY
jgi:hypothetical protein